MRTIEIFFNEPNWDDSLDLYYANGTQRLIADSILIDGVMDDSVGVKYKGNSSYNVNNTKNPMNIKLDYINNGQSIDGYNVLKLSNGFRDPSFVREVLAYEMAREYMPASKATYANVFINGNVMFYIYGMGIGFGYLVFIFILTWLLLKKQPMGLGDILLITVLGLWLGPFKILLSIFFSSVVGIFYWGLISIIRGFKKDRRLPFGSFLSIVSIIIYIIKL